MKISLLHTFDTKYSADSIEWCPHSDYRQYFVCGTYQIESDEGGTQHSQPNFCRKGCIYLFKFQKNNNTFLELERLETAAILDMKWLQNVLDPILAVVNANGQVQLYELKEEHLCNNMTMQLDADDCNLLALSLDTNSSPHNSTESVVHRILTSDSKGKISIFQYAVNVGVEKIHRWSAHTFEAWTCAFDKWNPNLVYTGGDDNLLHGFDMRTYDRVLTNKSHGAGVTSLLSHFRYEHKLLTGSYDEHLRIFDVRSLRQPLEELNLKGGIWRLKADPLDRNLVLAACMYHNFSIVSFMEDQLKIPVIVGEFSEHQSICYGVDWCLDVEKNDDCMHMATCSFYDHKLCLASISEIK